MEGFRRTEKACGLFELIETESKGRLALQDIRKDPAVTELPGDLRPLIERTACPRIFFLGDGHRGDAPENKANNPSISEAFVKFKAFLLELACTDKVAAVQSGTAKAAQSAGLQVGLANRATNVHRSLETPFRLLQIAVAAIE